MSEQEQSTTYREIKVRKLPCALTSEELEEYSEALTGGLIEIQALKADAKAYSTRIKGEIAKHLANVAKLTTVVHERQEERDIECESCFDYAADRIVVTRLDTEIVIIDRELEETEKQMQMQLEDGEEIGPVDDTTDETPADEKPAEIDDCDKCGGIGTGADGVEDCEACNGTGKDPDFAGIDEDNQE